MKILSTIQNLWDYCLFCPICQKENRKIELSVGPDEVCTLNLFTKYGQWLTLGCSLHIKNQIQDVRYLINCLDNSFKFFILNTSSHHTTVEKASSPYFYFYINAQCVVCGNAQVCSTDLELDLLNNQVINIGIDFEEILLYEGKDNFNLEFDYSDNNMNIYKSIMGDGIRFRVPIKCPIIDFDFSNLNKTINKIKTILVFS